LPEKITTHSTDKILIASYEKWTDFCRPGQMAVDKYPVEALKDIGKISDDGFLVFDLTKNKSLYCNDSLSAILEKPASQIMKGGREAIISSLQDEMTFLSQLFGQLKANSKVSNVELRVKSSEEKRISVDAYLVDGDKVIVIVKDITKSRQHLNYIIEFGARKDTILDGISHRLSAPLNLTNHLLDMLDRISATQNYKKIEQPARLIRENTQHCIDTINSFLREEHITSPEIPVGITRFDVLARVKVVVDRYAEFNPTKALIIISSGTEIFATGDDVKFFQVVNNLVSNAVKFTNDNGKIIVDVSDYDSNIVVKVKDDGIGIPEYLHPHLFSKSTPAARPGLKGEKSTGLGLYIIRRLITQMKGNITFQSQEGNGSVFTVTLPKAVSV
jgi:two-component system sensor histidine kinase VicK